MNSSIIFYLALIIISTSLNVSSGNNEIKGNFNQRIINGIVASQYQAPWQVVIETYSGDATFSTSVYNGAIIGPRYVLTTGSACARKIINNEILKIKYGGTDRINLPYSAEINWMIIHPNWTNNYNGLGDNLCVIRLKNPVQTSPTSNVIPIAKVQPSNGTQANYTSWGQISSSAFPTSLRVANLSIIAKDGCQQKYGNLRIITDNITCADSTPYTSCTGDVGAPLVINGELVGILSWINYYSCSTSSPYPDIFVNTVFARDWIESTIDNGLECPSTTSTNSPSTSSSSIASSSTFSSNTTAPSISSSGTIGLSSTTSKPLVTSTLPPDNCGVTPINISLKLSIKIDQSNSSNPIITAEVSDV